MDDILKGCFTSVQLDLSRSHKREQEQMVSSNASLSH